MTGATVTGAGDMDKTTAEKPGGAQAAVRKLFQWMPFFFGIGFIAPLIAQMMEHWEIEAPFGLSRIALGLGIGAAWGLYAVIRGRWI